MQIHVIQQGDTIESVAATYGISEELLMRDNDISYDTKLVIGQCLVVAIPLETYVVQMNDTLEGIAETHNITVMELFRNNPILSEREYIYPGETLVIRYDNTMGKMTIHGNVFPFVNPIVLRKTLPYLTYLSVINYTATNEGEIISYFDDTALIEEIKAYGVMPLMLLTTLTLQGNANIRVAYDLLLNEEFQRKQINNILNILTTKGYYGVNISFQYINLSTLRVYEEYLSNLFSTLDQAGFYVFVTISPEVNVFDSQVEIEPVNYSRINQLAHNIIFMSYEWATNINPPSPIISITNISLFIDYIKTIIPPDKAIIGIPTVGYDWQLPFVAGVSEVRLLTISNAIELARNVDAVIQFDDISQTPYYIYYDASNNISLQHIVWFIDARSIDELLNLAVENGLLGSGIWNIMNYNAQLWLLINSQYEIIKIL
jgi:spore germination protein